MVSPVRCSRLVTRKDAIGRLMHLIRDAKDPARSRRITKDRFSKMKKGCSSSPRLNAKGSAMRTMVRATQVRRTVVMQPSAHASRPLKTIKACRVRPSSVRILLSKMGLRPAPSANLCLALGNAFMDVTRVPGVPAKTMKRGIYPVNVVGSGVAGFVFEMSDGSIAKLMGLDSTGGLVEGGHQVLSREFVYEAIATQQAHRKFCCKLFDVPDVLNYAIIVPKASPRNRIGFFHITRLQGNTVLNSFRRMRSSKERQRMMEQWGRILAHIHNKGWIHGDFHTNNTLYDNGRFRVLDWARSNQRRFFPAAKANFWRNLQTYDVSFCCRDIQRSFGKRYMLHFVKSYVTHLRGKPTFEMHALVDDIEAFAKQYIRYMWAGLDLVTKSKPYIGK